MTYVLPTSVPVPRTTILGIGLIGLFGQVDDAAERTGSLLREDRLVFTPSVVLPEIPGEWLLGTEAFL